VFKFGDSRQPSRRQDATVVCGCTDTRQRDGAGHLDRTLVRRNDRQAHASQTNVAPHGSAPMHCAGTTLGTFQSEHRDTKPFNHRSGSGQRRLGGLHCSRLAWIGLRSQLRRREHERPVITNGPMARWARRLDLAGPTTQSVGRRTLAVRKDRFSQYPWSAGVSGGGRSRRLTRSGNMTPRVGSRFGLNAGQRRPARRIWVVRRAHAAWRGRSNRSKAR